MKEFYQYTADILREKSGKPIEVVETDIDLYYHMALEIYEAVEEGNREGRNTRCIMPVGPVFQYRRFITLCKRKPLDLSRLHVFFMDEYLIDGAWIEKSHPLSFRGFIQRELIDPMPPEMNLKPAQMSFPDPKNPAAYDKAIEDLGGLDFCHAGVGLVGHLAFNEPLSGQAISKEEFAKLPSRVVDLTPETIAINSNTALKGALDEIPPQAVTVGMKAILSARKLNIYFNRPWQNAVCRKALMLEETPEFPVTLARTHPGVSYIMTEEVARPLDAGLK